MKKTLLVISLITFCLWLPSSYKRWTHGFRPNKCRIFFPFVADWEINPRDEDQEKIKAILSKPFTYLSKGKQSFVFESLDHQYVIKLFRFEQCKTPLGKKLQQKEPISLQEKAKRLFNSCTLAYTLAKQQTGLIFIHLNPKKSDLPMIQIKDRLKRSYLIAPSIDRFVVQKKAQPFLKTFREHPHELSKWIDAYETLLDEIAALGLVNSDNTMAHNFGFLKEKCIQIDLGDFIYDPDLAVEKSLYFKEHLQKWVAKRFSK